MLLHTVNSSSAGPVQAACHLGRYIAAMLQSDMLITCMAAYYALKDVVENTLSLLWGHTANQNLTRNQYRSFKSFCCIVS
jgi:hypothetical protein